VTDELFRVHTKCGAREKKLRETVLNGFRFAFLPDDEREEMYQYAEAAIALP
jgi:hypothetical protein